MTKGSGDGVRGGGKTVAQQTSRIMNPETRDDFADRLRTIAEYGEPGYELTAKVSDWEKGGKSRTYMSIDAYRESDGRKHHSFDYGYFDNNKGEFVSTKKYAPLNGDTIFSASGNDKLGRSEVETIVKKRKKKSN